MKSQLKFNAITRLLKSAQTVPIRATEQQAAYDRYMQNRRLNGQKMVARNKWYNKALDELSSAPGNFVKAVWDDVTDGTVARNLYHGAKSFANGMTSGALEIPGAVAGGVHAIGSFLGDIFTDNWKDSIDNAGKAYSKTKDYVEENLGFDNYTLGHAKRYIAEQQAKNLEAYAKNNNIDPNNVSGLDRAGLFGINLARSAGEALPATMLLGNAKAGPIMSGLITYDVGADAASNANKDIRYLNDRAPAFQGPRSFGAIDTGKALSELRKNKPTVKLTTDTSRQTK